MTDNPVQMGHALFMPGKKSIEEYMQELVDLEWKQNRSEVPTAARVGSLTHFKQHVVLKKADGEHIVQSSQQVEDAPDMTNVRSFPGTSAKSRPKVEE